jgi:glutathione S-transferase
LLDLYFRPFACSLASRIALLEAGVAARYHQVDLTTKRLVGDDGDFFAVTRKGQVPVLRLDDGSLLTESIAVLQYIADLRPNAGLAPPPGDPERYRLQEWLSFVATELHKGWTHPTFMHDTPDPVKAHARSLLPGKLEFVAAHLAQNAYLLGERFSVADAFLLWALVLTRFAGVDLANWPSLVTYLEALQKRPSVGEALAIERALL